MAKHLDLEEQEQLDELKHFWNTYGNLITWALIAVFGTIAAWNGWQYWQRTQAAQASVMFDEVDRAAAAGDVARLERSFTDMKDKFGGTTYAQQAGLLAAKAFQAQGRADAAKAALSWVAEKSADPGYSAVARLRLAGVLVDGKAYDEALKQLTAEFPAEFQPLAADRRGDVSVEEGALHVRQVGEQVVADDVDLVAAGRPGRRAARGDRVVELALVVGPDLALEGRAAGHREGGLEPLPQPAGAEFESEVRGERERSEHHEESAQPLEDPHGAAV